ncbi:hypothetical protein HDE_12956 [Halotydeus destructor]|nr:hypothetical protein HDE_12956 [Halotydeus destructor]
MRPVAIPGESSELLVPLVVRDMRCPCPETRAEFEAFISSQLTSYDDQVSRVIVPQWLLNLEDYDDRSFIGEMVLLCYPSLSSVPPELTYPRLLLEQYSAATSCKWTDFEMPGCIGHNSSSYEQFGFPFSLTGEAVLVSVAPGLTKINLAYPLDFGDDYARTFLEKIANGETPKLETLEFHLEDFTDEKIAEKIKIMNNQLDIIGHLMQHETKDLPLYTEVWESWPAHRASLTVHCSPPMDEDIFQFASSYATKLVAEADQLLCLEEKDLLDDLPAPKRQLFKLVRELDIPETLNPDIDTFMKYFETMEMPNLEKIEIGCLAILREFPKIYVSSKCQRLRHFEAKLILGLTSREPPPLQAQFKENVRNKMLKQSQDNGQLFGDFKEPYDLNPEYAHDPDGFYVDHDSTESINSSAIPPRMSRRKLKDDLASQQCKLLLRNTLWCLADTSSKSLVTADLSFYNIGGFTSALCRFLLVMLNRECASLEVLPVSLEGGLHVKMIPVVFGLCRNWRKVEFSFWCPFESYGEALEITRKTILAEQDKHTAITIVVDCEEAIIFGEVINGETKLVVQKGEDNRYAFGKMKIPRKVTAAILRPIIPFVQRRSIEIADMVGKEIAGLTGLFSDVSCELMHNACDHRKSSDEKIAKLVSRMEYYDSLEHEVSQRIITVLCQ